MSTARAFVAIEPGERFRSWIEPVLADLAGRYRRVRWVRPENVHLTLRFLGDVETERVGDVIGALAAAVAGHPAPAGGELRLEIEGPGSFGRRGAPRVFWLGFRRTDVIEYVTALQARIEDAARRLGCEAERRRWTPHMTVGRNRGGKVPDDWRQQVEMKLPEVPDIITGEIVLFESELTRGGSMYRALGRVPLVREGGA